MIIGVTGGVGTGKSSVLDILSECYNAAIIKTDDVAKELSMPGGPSYMSTVDHFGEGILTDGPGSPINRPALAEIVFNDESKLELLNSLTHPPVKKKVMELVEIYKKQGFEYIVIETAILIQAGYLEFLDELWVVYADMDVRAERLIQSRGYSMEKIRSIMDNQMSFEEMKEYADFIIDNSGDIENTGRQIREHLECRK